MLAITQVPPSRQHQIVAAAHRVELAGQVEGDHDLLAGAVAA